MTINEDLKSHIESLDFVHSCGLITDYRDMFKQVEVFVLDTQDAHVKLYEAVRSRFPEVRLWPMVIKHRPAKNN